MTQREHKELHKFIHDQLEKGYIQPSNSPYTTLFFFIGKKGTKELRPIMDYQPINKYMIPNQYQSLRIDDLIQEVAKSTLFTLVDLVKGYNNLCMRPGHERKAAFLMALGLSNH